ncbi:MAG: universal stress protein [Chloroflexota bacterium]
MLPFKNILSPTDFSEHSYKAITVANELALYFGATLCVLHVVSLTPILVSSPTAPAFDIATYQERLETNARAELQGLVARLVSKEVKECEPMVTTGSYADEIIRIANERKSDLIVIGTRGRTGFPHLLLGSVAERVVQLAPCPVLTIGKATEV